MGILEPDNRSKDSAVTTWIRNSYYLRDVKYPGLLVNSYLGNKNTT